MSDLEPITRDEVAWSNGDIEPITRKEKYIKHLYDETQEIPDPPQTREEWFIKKAGEEIHDVTIEPLTATQNGTYSESGKAYSPVTVAVPLGSKNITANGTYNASDDSLEGYSSVSVDVPLPDNAYLKKDLPTGAIATVTDAEAEVMPSLKIAITPVQEGSGDPSPTNIRPITGWSGAEVNVCGKNLFDKDSYTVGNVAFNDARNDRITRSGVKIALPQGVYTFKCFRDTPYGYIYVYKNNGENYIADYKLSTNGGWQTCVITVNAGDELFLVAAVGGATLKLDMDLEIVAGNEEPTTYEPYSGTTYTIPFTDGTDHLEVYGGTLDVVNGVLTVTDVIKTFIGDESEEWSALSVEGAFLAENGFAGAPSDMKTSTNSPVCLCNMYKESSSIQSSSSMEERANNVFCNQGRGEFYKRLFIKDTRFTDVNDFTQMLSSQNLKVVYPLATPITYQLSQTAIKTLKDTNNISADTGDILDGEYWSKNPLTVTRQMLNSLQQAGEITEITPTEESDEQ